MNVSQKITDILNYYHNNPGCNPNMYEFVELCYNMVVYLYKEAPNYGIHAMGGVTNEKGKETITPISKEERKKQYPIPCAVYEKFTILSQLLEQKLLGNDLGITKDSPLYKLFKELSNGVGTYSAYDDTPLKAKLGGVALFIAQKKRDVAKGIIEDFKYDNHAEFEEILMLDQQFHDPQSGGYYVGPEGVSDISKMRYVESEPSPRKLLLEEIRKEYQKALMIR